MLWVEQPVGTGFSQGAPLVQVCVASLCISAFLLYDTGQNQVELAEELVGFMQQFLEVFSELKGNKLYLTGESVSHYNTLLGRGS